MSHWFSVKTKFLSQPAITKTANELGFIVKSNAICRGYNGQKKKCDLVVQLPGEYDLGLEKQADNSYLVSADFWWDHISQYLADPTTLASAEKASEDLRSDKKYAEADAAVAEAKMSKFTKMYNRFAVQELAKAQGLQYMESILEDGTMVLELTGNPY
ncbi:DUF1257 domain-containing protein [Bacteroides sp.]|uniref:DUF1257 domain-containing protein n=1 Tax=Bacteroides sp. TaxID=29523 RepID=UPI002622417B|nr:DUF1257 domain-containing protein [Bacteroides sp.]MDD3040450.1 DUF1257 domain-containing protein [Bacteroides sp.]